MKQTTVVYKNVNVVEQLKIEIDKETSAGWYVHEVVRSPTGHPWQPCDYVVIWRKDEE